MLHFFQPRLAWPWSLLFWQEAGKHCQTCQRWARRRSRLRIPLLPQQPVRPLQPQPIPQRLRLPIPLRQPIRRRLHPRRPAPQRRLTQPHLPTLPRLPSHLLPFHRRITTGWGDRLAQTAATKSPITIPTARAVAKRSIWFITAWTLSIPLARQWSPWRRVRSLWQEMTTLWPLVLGRTFTATS